MEKMNNSSSFDNDSSSFDGFQFMECEEIDFETYRNVSWSIKGIVVTIIGVIGILTNFIAIPILCSQEMKSTFSRLLIVLAVFDVTYLGCSIFVAVRHKFYRQ